METVGWLMLLIIVSLLTYSLGKAHGQEKNDRALRLALVEMSKTSRTLCLSLRIFQQEVADILQEFSDKFQPREDDGDEWKSNLRN